MTTDVAAAPKPAWAGVMAMTLCVAVLIASEFMPVSLLTPIASSLNLTEGQAGQSISISGLFAVATALLIAHLTRHVDRRRVILSLSALLVVSGAVVALAPDFQTLMAGRALLGLVVGGFWSMSTAIVMRLLPERDVPAGLSLLNAGNAVATTISAPLGSFLGDYVGWRGAFSTIIPLAILAFAWQWLSLPRLPPPEPKDRAGFRSLWSRQIALGMTAIFLLFMGQFALFTYLRPYLQSIVGFSVSGLSLLLLAMGIAGVLGTWCISRLLGARLFQVLVAIPLVMACIAGLLIAFSATKGVVFCLLFAWGFVGTAAPVGWGTWLSRAARQNAELGGGLQVAVIQCAIAVGAASGGLLYDHVGMWGTLSLSAALLAGSALFAVLSWRHAR